MLTGFTSVLFSFVGSFLRYLPFFLKFILMLSTVNDILSSEFNRVQHPLEQLTQRYRIFLYLFDLLFMFPEGSLEEPEFLIGRVLVLFGAEGVVLADPLEELSAVSVRAEEDLSGFLPLDLVGISLADVLPSVPEQVEQGLEHLGHLDHVILPEG